MSAKITSRPGLHEEVIFDADKDNLGKGISVDDMIKALKKIKNEKSRAPVWGSL